MKLKLKKLIESFSSFSKLGDCNFPKMGLDFQNSKKIIKLIKDVKEEVKIYEKLHSEIALNSGFVQKQGQPGTFEVLDLKNKDSIIAEYGEKHEELLNNEIEIDYEMIDINYEKALQFLTGNDIIILSDFFNFKE